MRSVFRAPCRSAERRQFHRPAAAQPIWWRSAQFGNNPFATEEPDTTQQADTTKRIRKPLESFLFDDSTRNRPNFAWHVDTYRNKIEFAEIDTLLEGFQLDQPYRRKGVGDAYQGNMGGASIPINYFDRPHYSDFSFAEAFDAYLFSPENVRFFNVKAAFSQFQYLSSGKKRNQEENFVITHAQNISPSSGFNLDYRSRGTEGLYNSQKGRAKSLSVAFSHTGKRYTVHAGYIYNAILNRENGGLIRDNDLPDLDRYELPSTYPTKMSGTRNYLKNNAYYVVQSYGFPLRRVTDEDFSIAKHPTIFVGHSFQYQRWNKNYTDTYRGATNSTVFDPSDPREPGDDYELNYYDKWYINGSQTRDSIFESRISNRFFIQVQPWDRDGVVGTIDGGVGIDNHYYYFFRPNTFTAGKWKGQNKTDYYVYGSIDGKIKRYVDWGADVNFHPSGGRSGDLYVAGRLTLNAYIKDTPISLSGRFSNELRSPTYWSERYFSNHYQWQNSFDKENETRFEASLTMPEHGLEVTFAQSVIANRIYYGPDILRPTQDGIPRYWADGRLPVQESGGVSVTGLYVRKDFRAGGFHFNHRVLLQWSSADKVVPVPLASAFISYFFEFDVVRDVLRVELGIDGRYNTEYYAPGWSPGTTVFYNQRERKTGNYPMMDAFINAKWKRMRILFKMEHWNYDLFGGHEYFSLPHYPLNKRMFKMGISWAFYD